jgi:ubiquinone biosynthesis protein UbiJ
MTASSKFSMDLHYTPAEVEQQNELREAYWECIHLLVELKFAQRITEEQASTLGYDALLAWFNRKVDDLKALLARLQD